MSVQSLIHDFEQKLAFCNWIREQTPDFHLKILFSDKCSKVMDLSIFGTAVIGQKIIKKSPLIKTNRSSYLES